MNLAQRLEFWGDRHHPLWVDVVRICFGIFLCFKGVEFLNNMGALMGMITNKLSFNNFALALVSHYVVFAHIAGGVLIAMGLLTRFACIIQIPILLGAIFLVNSSGDMFRPFSELWLSSLTLLLLLGFLILGNGKWSFQWFVDRDKRAGQ